jgi:Fe-S cluster assembly iron-binding protein IscA
MLTLTENAGTVVSGLVARATDVDTAGLRIQPGPDRFDLAIADAPTPEEVVIEQGDARVFMEPPIAEVLDAMVLDAQIDGNGGISFGLAPQP